MLDLVSMDDFTGRVPGGGGPFEFIPGGLGTGRGGGGPDVYDPNGFLTDGVSQSSGIWDVLSNLGSTAINDVFGSAFQQRPSFGQLPAATPSQQTIPATHPVLTAGGMSATTPTMGGGGGAGRYGVAGQKGYHMIKKGPHAGMWTKNRHRNPCNPRALRRALSRAHGFERFARKVMHFVHPGRRGRLVFKRRRRAR